MSLKPLLVKATYSFKGKNNDELCFKKGDIITVTQQDDGWWEGTLGETTGWFPSNYVTEENSSSATTSPVRAPSEVEEFRNVVLKDIIDSEKAHIAELQCLVNNFLTPLESKDILSRDEFKQLTGNLLEVLHTHEQLLSVLEEASEKSGADQRVGGLFLHWAPMIKSVHLTYCASHPRAVCILDKYKDELNTFMESRGAVHPGLLVLTAGLSKPFRHLTKYGAMLQELARHVHDAHPDRGDTHRALHVYKDIAASCASLRRQKELELQVVTGAVRGWVGGPLSTLGEVIYMGGVAVGLNHFDRYFVLFPASLLILSVSKRTSAFVFEGCLPLSGIKCTKLPDTETRKNSFEIRAPMIDPIVAVCQTKREADNWVGLLHKYTNQPGSPPADQQQPHSLQNMAEWSSDSYNLMDALSTNSPKRSQSFNYHSKHMDLPKTVQNKDYNDTFQKCEDPQDDIASCYFSSHKSVCGESETSQQKSNDEGWMVVRLRPTPPLRTNASSCDSSSRRSPQTRGYEHDALLLRVIAAYCASPQHSSEDDRSEQLTSGMRRRAMNNNAPRSSWCCGTFAKQLNQFQHMD